jgi:hypothetical protein
VPSCKSICIFYTAGIYAATSLGTTALTLKASQQQQHMYRRAVSGRLNPALVIEPKSDNQDMR